MKRILLALLVAIPVAAAPTIASAQPYYAGGYNGDSWSLHDGLTWEGSIGVGVAYASADGNSDSEVALGYSLGIGGFVSPQLAISLRAAGTTFFPSDNNGNTVEVSSNFLGISGQYWYQRNAWVSAGAGFALLRQFSDYSYFEQDDTGFALDFRAGFTFGRRWRHSYNFSVDVTPAFYGDLTLVNATVQLGYQFL